MLCLVVANQLHLERVEAQLTDEDVTYSHGQPMLTRSILSFCINNKPCDSTICYLHAAMDTRPDYAHTHA